ncbi:hypothetical protein [Antrihabitans sp. YC2-6]|uniref:hypothetical protein n=1 Tax=Antrihabitans sp. YC2-6 TaxID=2799498 RepID=UPI0018F647EE|nr:hypothetical protein [Antrihabitans sp. YC2-6]MBJ8343936.1 hypothetical protein [Antrihabitans sp. YC2-6]
MPVLGAKELKKYILPSDTPESPSYAVLNVRVSAPQAFAIHNASADEAEAATYRLLSELIDEWSYTDVNGVPSPITPENVSLMDFNDLQSISNVLADKINLTITAQAVSGDAKKE